MSKVDFVVVAIISCIFFFGVGAGLSHLNNYLKKPNNNDVKFEKVIKELHEINISLKKMAGN